MQGLGPGTELKFFGSSKICRGKYAIAADFRNYWDLEMLLQLVQHAAKGTQPWPVNCVVCSKENLLALPLAPKMTNMQNHASIRNQSSTKDPRDCPRERWRCLSKGSTWIGSDSQGKGVPAAKVLMGSIQKLYLTPLDLKTAKRTKQQ